MARHLALLVTWWWTRTPSAIRAQPARAERGCQPRSRGGGFKVPREIGIPALRIAFSTR